MDLIYTIGKKSIYEPLFVNMDEPKKLGRTPDYEGGSVWKTKNEAAEYLKDGFEIYGVFANWETDTEPSDEGNWNNLIVSSPLVKLPENR